MKSKLISTDIQIFNILLEEVEQALIDKLINISLTLDLLRRELQTHGQDTMLNHNSVLMEMPLISKILANVTELSTSVEERMKKEKELKLGTNSECGHPFQSLKMFTLDVTNTYLVKLRHSRVIRDHAGVSQLQTTSLPSVLKKLVTIASVMEELFLVKEIRTLNLVTLHWLILVSTVFRQLEITGLLTVSTTLGIKPVVNKLSKTPTHFLIKIRDAIVTKRVSLFPPLWSNLLKSTGELLIDREKSKLKKSELKLLPLQRPRKPRKKELLKRKELRKKQKRKKQKKNKRLKKKQKKKS